MTTKSRYAFFLFTGIAAAMVAGVADAKAKRDPSVDPVLQLPSDRTKEDECSIPPGRYYIMAPCPFGEQTPSKRPRRHRSPVEVEPMEDLD